MVIFFFLPIDIYYYYYHFHTFVQCYFASISSRNNYSVLPNRPKFPFANIYHLTLQFPENHLTIHSRENRKQSNDGRLENVLRFQSPIFRIHTCIRIRPFLSNDGKLHVWRRQGFSQQHDYNFFLQSAMNFERSNLDNTGAGFQSATDRWGFCPIVIRSNQRATVLIVSLLVLFSLFSIDNYNCAIIVFN